MRTLATFLAILLAFGSLVRAVEVRVEPIHTWLPPFGIERVGRTHQVIVESKGSSLRGPITFSYRLNGEEVASYRDEVKKAGTMWVHPISADFEFDEIVVFTHDVPKDTEAGRQRVQLPRFEAAAAVAPEQPINPVDLGAILVPGDWLLLGPGQTGKLTVRALQRGKPAENLTIKAWFVSRPEAIVTAKLTLTRAERNDAKIDLPPASAEHDTLRVSVIGGSGQPLWEKQISTMRVASPPKLPAFGAVETKLRYDAPISVRDPKTGQFSGIPYDTAWDEKLNDVVVALPNGSRLVFWRGSSYIPLWLTAHNVAACTEWAEITSQPAGSTDCVEPLMDKELRYGRVKIVESTPARVHVRWTYQSNDLLYKVWGDQTVEDYYFYPDGFGTRVLTLNRDPSNKYELSEFIAIAPAETYPWSFVPQTPIDIVFTDGESRHVTVPGGPAMLGKPRDVPAVYRLHPHKDDRASLVYFSPRERNVLPGIVFGHFSDQGQMVTPAYWGSHWPLARGNATGSKIDERIHLTPHHTSLMSWVNVKPEPLWTQTGVSIDALGRSKVMTREQWVWMLGMTDASDADVIARAKSFGNPPSVQASGARIHPDGYAPDRRAVRLVAEKADDITLTITPSGTACVDPVFEIEDRPGKLATIALDGKPIDASHFAWDGRVLWIDATINRPAALTLHFQP